MITGKTEMWEIFILLLILVIVAIVKKH